VYFRSLAMLTDGVHTLSDAVTVCIALWARRARNKYAQSPRDRFPFGLLRAEILGAFVNAIALITLCVYIILDAIPRFWNPEEIDATWVFIGIAGGGIFINLCGVFLFCGADGEEMGHAHSHGGHSHGHSHGSKKQHTSIQAPEETKSPLLDTCEEGHAHGGHDHGHSHASANKGHDHSHEHASSGSCGGHDHSHASSSSKGGHDHSHDHKPAASSCGGHDHDHGHSSSHKDHSHEGHDHGHGHDEKHEDEERDSFVGREQNCLQRCFTANMNILVVVVHSLGDAFLSGVVFAMGLIIHYYDDDKDGGHSWTDYLDPVASLAVSVFVMYSSIPVVKSSGHLDGGYSTRDV